MGSARRRVLVPFVLLGVLASCGPSSGGDGAPAPAPAGDPLTDAAAWRALPAADRAKRAAEVAGRANFAASASAERTHGFFLERGEDGAAADAVRRRLEFDPDCAWARGVRGEFEISERATRCLEECELAEAEGVAPVAELRALAGRGGRKWVDAATSKRADELIAAVRAEDQRLSSPYEAGVAKWVRWQRGYRVMMELPEVHATAGRYLVFVSTGGSEPERSSKAAQARAKVVLERYKGFIAELETAWARDVAGPLGLAVYAGATADERTILKVNVFTELDDFYAYQFDMDSWDVEFSPAHYVSAEPRFLAAVLPTSASEWTSARDSFLVQATRQLVHFHTWDATRKSRDRELDYAQCLHRPFWSAEGFPRFFAHHASTPMGRHPWIGDVYVSRGVAAAKGWKPWTLAEQLSIKDRAELSAAARRRSGESAVTPLSELFVARAAGLADFLWNAEDAGRPRYRDRYLAYLAGEMIVKTRIDFNGQEVCVRPGIESFRAAFGLGSDELLAAFEKQWDAYEAALIERENDPSWDARVKRWIARIDHPDEK